MQKIRKEKFPTDKIEINNIEDLKEVTKKNVKLIIDQIKRHLKDTYLFPDKVVQLCDALDSDYLNGVYDNIVEPQVLVETLTKTLQSTIFDKHLRVRLPSEIHCNSKPRQPLRGIEKIEILTDNIGYIFIESFLPLNQSENTILGAMQFVRNTDALIIDLRKCRGGNADSTNFLLSYFFNESNTLILKTYFRPNNSDIQIWSSWTPYKYMNPVFVLISNYTFSAGEHFAFALKIHKKANLVGNNTGGGAHPVAISYFDIGVALTTPIGRTYDPITDKDWEGVGVVPDIECNEKKALEIAKKMILEKQLEMKNEKTVRDEFKPKIIYKKEIKE